MSQLIIQDSTLTDIANAIRAKTGGSEELSPSDMVHEIESSLENPEGTVNAVTDGTYDVGNAASLVVQNNVITDDMLYYDYDEQSTTLTISVNPNPSYVYDEITIDKLLADLYIGSNERSYTTPVMKGMDWFKAWLTRKGINTFAKYNSNGSKAAWYYFQRGLLAEDYDLSNLDSCDTCGGTGEMEVCPDCSGAGIVILPSAQTESCSVCGGDGTITVGTTCQDCGGTGRIGVPDSTSGTIIFVNGVFREGHYETCSTCNGVGGWYTNETCDNCGGTGSVTVGAGSKVFCGTCDGKGVVAHTSGTAIDCPDCCGTGDEVPEMLETGYTITRSGTIVDRTTQEESGSISYQFDANTHKLTTVYRFDDNQSISYIDFSVDSSPLFNIQSIKLPFGTYVAQIKSRITGTDWTGTWPAQMTIRFSGGMDDAQNIVIQADGEQSFVISSANSLADSIYLQIDPSTNVNIRTTPGAVITHEITVSLKMLSVTNNLQTAKLSDVLRYADSIPNRYWLRYLGANYPLLLLDPQAITAKGYPYDSVDHNISGAAENESTSGIEMTANYATPFVYEDATGTQRTANSLKTLYKPTGSVYGYLTTGSNGATAGETYKSSSFKICRKGDADG